MAAEPKYTITYNEKDKNWVAVEEHPDDAGFLARMGFYGYGDTPEAALADIHNAHETLNKCLREV